AARSTESFPAPWDFRPRGPLRTATAARPPAMCRRRCRCWHCYRGWSERRLLRPWSVHLSASMKRLRAAFDGGRVAPALFRRNAAGKTATGSGAGWRNGCCSFVFATYFRHECFSDRCGGRYLELPPADWDTVTLIVEIVILAMIAAFLGLRLYSVLGRRAEHEEEPIPTRFETPDGKASVQPAPPALGPQSAAARDLAGFPPAIERDLRDIAAADRSFELLPFLEGAKSAYEMILEAFWRGDREELKELCDDDVYAGFAAAIDEREAASLTLDNRLIRIEDTTVHSAALDGK